ncbi:YfcC family protein [Mesoplasma florum]|uniref:YfcC family protein n=1 Tax=Mesoplasma florum TaxID=2151 RepID=UPI0018E098E1|nr:YfcC family protein [Mesoplasma florum]
MTATEKRKDEDFNLTAKQEKPQKRKFKMWSAFSILLLIIAFLVLLSWILHWAGVSTDVTSTIETPWTDPVTGLPGTIITETTNPTKIQAAGLVDILFAPMKGFQGKADVIIFILVLGAFIQLTIASKSLQGFSQGILAKLQGKEIYAIIPLMIFFSICGTAEGMAEESLGFYMICIPLMIAAGYDTFTGLMIVLVGAGVGVICSTVNPFVITIAMDGLNNGSGLSGGNGISAGDGLVWRLITWMVMTGAAIAYVMWYANKVKNNPSKSVTFSTYEGDKQFFLSENNEKIVMTGKRKASLAIFGLTFLVMIMYLVNWDSITGTTAMADFGDKVNQSFPYLTSMIPGFGQGGLDVVATIFLIGAIIMSLVLGLGEDGFLQEFMAGASDILSVCLVIATAAGVGVILEATHLQELFVSGLNSSIGGINSQVGKILVLFILFLPLSFLIPSSSGFAAAIFPLIATSVAVKDSNGVVTGFQDAAASGSVMAFSMANGILNLFTPTSGVVMGAVAISRVGYDRFLKGIWPVVLGAFIISIIMLSIGGAIGGSIA